MNKRKSGVIVHKRLPYLGCLSGLDSAARLLLLERIECLLLYRYDNEACEASVEALAVGFVNKYYSRHAGHNSARMPLDVGGGMIAAENGEERILLQSHKVLRSPEVGGEWLLWQAMEELGIKQFLRGCEGWAEKDIDVFCMSLLGRALYPASELKTSLWLLEQSSGPDLLGASTDLGDDALHRSNAKLLGIHRGLEAHLYGRMDSLLGFEGLRFLYDMTNTYFEGLMAGSTLAQFGRSKEKRSDCRLVSIGLLANEWGFVKHSDFHAGNISEPSTFAGVLKVVPKGEGIMMDAGIGTQENIGQAAVLGIPYMCVTRERFSPQEMDFSGATVFEHQPSNKTKPYKVSVYVKEHTFTVGEKVFGDRLIFVKSEAKEGKEQGMLQRQVQRMEKGLELVKAALSKAPCKKDLQAIHERIGRLKEKNASVNKAFDIKILAEGTKAKAIEWKYDRKVEVYNGTYVIRTSMPVASARQGWETYHLMTQRPSTSVAKTT